MVAGCVTNRDAGPKKGCETFLIVPPQHASLAASDAVVTAWVDAVLPHLDKCAKMIKPDASKEVFHFVNVNNTSPLDMKNPNEAQLKTLRSKTTATHVVFLSFKVSHRTLAVRATIYRLKPKWMPTPRKVLADELVARIEKRLDKGSPLVAGEADVRSLFAGLIPNSVTFGAGDSKLTNTRVEHDEIAEVEAHRRDALPRFIQGIGIANVAHRYGFKLFDADWGLSGALRFLADSPNLVYQYKDATKRATPEQTFDYSYDFISLAALVTIDGFLYWPLGTTFGGFGVGLAPYRFQDSTGRSITALDALARLRVGHRVFLSDRWYAELSVDQITFTGGIADGEEFKGYTMVSGWFGLGWFFPRRGWLE